MTIQARERLILALDVPHDRGNPDRFIEPVDATNLVNELDELISVVKIGWPLYMAGGNEVVQEMVKRKKKVFLDLKFGDIGEAVKRVVQVAAGQGVSFLTVNTGFSTVAQAVQARGNSSLKILTVTVLTSLDQSDLLDNMGTTQPVDEIVLRKTERAIDVGCDGIIASGREAQMIRQRVKTDFLIITPGIRPAGVAHHDQKRVATPTDAIGSGADYLVVGRPITQADNPRQATVDILAEMQRAFDSRQ